MQHPSVEEKNNKKKKQFFRLDDAKSYASLADSIPPNLPFPHSPFLSAVFCDQRYSPLWADYCSHSPATANSYHTSL